MDYTGAIGRHVASWKQRARRLLVALAALGALPLIGTVHPASAPAPPAHAQDAQTHIAGIPFGHLPNDPNDHPERYGRPPKRPLFAPPPPPPPPPAIDGSDAVDPGES